MLLRSSVMVMLEAPAGNVVTWTYPFGRGFFAKTPDMGRQTEFPHRTFPLFMNPEPEITPFLRTACAEDKRRFSRVISYVNYPKNDWGIKEASKEMCWKEAIEWDLKFRFECDSRAPCDKSPRLHRLVSVPRDLRHSEGTYYQAISHFLRA